MNTNESEVKPHRMTMAEVIERQHEQIMAQATKTPRTGSESAEFGQVATGDLKGAWIAKGLGLVRGEGEDWPQFIGRIEQTLDTIDRLLIQHNADRIKRELEATLERKPEPKQRASTK